tara:strand:- start:669 stop:866 length:198 start_codon:yes stop_codon:yes gene_type:complete
MKNQNKIIRLNKLDEEKELLVNWDTVMYVYPTSARGKGEFSDIYFLGGATMPVKETVEEILELTK